MHGQRKYLLSRWGLATDVATIPLFLIPLTLMMITPWPLGEASLWVGYGKNLWNNSSFLYHDTVSILPTDNNISCAWLLSLIYYGIYRFSGIFGVVHFHHIVLIILLLVVYRESILKNPWPWSLQIRGPIYVFWLGACSFFVPRPAFVAFLIFILAFIILDRAAAEGRRLSRRDWALLILLQILWTNTHGTFLILPVMVAWTLLFQGEWSRLDIIGFVALGFAILINPYGWRVIPYVLATRSRAMQLNINEWAPITAYSFYTDVAGKPSWVLSTQFIVFWLLFTALAGWVLVTVVKGRWPRCLRSPYVAVVLLAFSGLRNSTFCFYVLPIFLTHWTSFSKVNSKSMTSRQRPSFALIATSLSMAIIAIVASPYYKSHIRDFLPEKIHDDFDTSIPQIAADINLTNQPNCAVLNDLTIGGYLMMTLPNPLLIDGRLTPFTDAGLEAWLKFLEGGTGAEEMIKKSGACFAVLSLYRTPKLVEQMTSQFGFRILEKEEGYILLGR
jgi:hypothetical protein